MNLEKIAILGQPIDVINYSGAAQEILRLAQDPTRPYAVEAANTMVVTLARHDPSFRAVMDHFDLILPDGMPLIWCLNRQLPPGKMLSDRVYGPEFMLRVLDATQDRQEYRHYFLGGAPDVLAQLSENMSQRFPRAIIAGTYSPPFGPWDEAEQQKIIAQIRNSRANLIWVGLGCPKQEKWIAAQKHRLPAGVYFGIGAAFAFHAGRVKNSPLWIQKIGMEWAFRLLMEPRRLFSRYLKYNTLFLKYLLFGKSPSPP